VYCNLRIPLKLNLKFSSKQDKPVVHCQSVPKTLKSHKDRYCFEVPFAKKITLLVTGFENLFHEKKLIASAALLSKINCMQVDVKEMQGLLHSFRNRI